MYHATNRRRLTVSGLTVSAIYTHWLMITSSSGVGVSTRRILCRLEAHGHLDTNHYIGVIISHASLRCFWRNQNARKRLVGFRWGHLTALPQESTPALGLSGPLPLVVLPSRAEPQPKKSSVRHCRRLSFRLVLTVTWHSRLTSAIIILKIRWLAVKYSRQYKYTSRLALTSRCRPTNRPISIKPKPTYRTVRLSDSSRAGCVSETEWRRLRVRSARRLAADMLMLAMTHAFHARRLLLLPLPLPQLLTNAVLFSLNNMTLLQTRSTAHIPQ